MTRPEPLEHVRQRVIDHLAEVIRGADRQRLLEVAGDVVARGEDWRAIGRHLREFPDAVARPGHPVPLAFVRLARALTAAGFPDVTPPACARCGRTTVALRAVTPEGRVCGRCYMQHHARACAGCGRTAPIVARGLCGPCYNADPATTKICAACGRRRRAAAKLPDGSYHCQHCYARPHHVCVTCGDNAPAHAQTDDGPVCRGCYRSPKRPCGRCGRIVRISKRAADGHPDLCNSCHQSPLAQCASCGRVRPCRYANTRKPICKTCAPVARAVCAGCSRTKQVHARWPMGPVCVTCYSRIRATPVPCTACGTPRPLIAVCNGNRICGPCVGVDLVYACQQCGRSGDLVEAGRCARCVLSERLTDLLTGPRGAVSPHLEPVRIALITSDRPRSLLPWLRHSATARLMASLAQANQPITHDALDALPPRPAVHNLRELLIVAGVLPARNEDLDRIPAWLTQLLADAPHHHRNLVSPFAHWHLLRRARRRARPDGAAPFVRSRIRRSLDILSWLDGHGLSLDQLTQEMLERWLAEGTTTRYNADAFIAWARSRRLIGDLRMPNRITTGPERFVKEDDRVADLRRCLAEAAIPLELRVAGILVLLFGLLASRVRQLRKSDVIDRAGTTMLIIDGHELHLPPRVAELVRQQRDSDEPLYRLNRLARTANPWLFPGRSTTRPIARSYLDHSLATHGIRILDNRNTARLALAAELPASVLAALTGTSIGNATQWTNWAKRDWTKYIAEHAAAGGQRRAERSTWRG
ncbi:hypothetical protein K1W54_12325 [Micromonospora sp. CPCC 205371]|nr:hypothetical protein [Micromonospora sp. CPCC 205371]